MPAVTTLSSEISFDIPFGLPGFRYAEGKPLFTAFGCVLFEKETPTGYTYHAYELDSRRSMLISRRKYELDERDYEKIAAKMKELPFAGGGRLDVDVPTNEKLSGAKLAEILEAVFRELLPAHGYSIREPQAELAAHILDNLCRRNVTLAEAEVGIGKTLAYLTAAVLVKRGRANDFWLRGSFPGQSYADSAHLPVVVSTSSIALQNAIVRDYIPALSRILMEGGVIRSPLTCVLRKGREHYLCERRLRSNLADADETTAAVLAPLLAHTASIDLADAPGLTPYMKRRIGVQSRCASHCPHRANCRYQRHMENARSNRHDFQICNHNYLLADILRRKDSETPLIPHYQAVIIDEGHKFLAAARQMYGVELSASDIQPIAADIHSFDFRQGHSGSKIWRNAKKLLGQSKRLFEALEAGIADADVDDETERFPAAFDEDSTRHLLVIKRICGDLLVGLEEQQVQTRFKGKCAHVLWELAGLEKRAAALHKHGDLVCWTERRGKELVQCGIPKNLDELLFQDFWSKAIPVVLTSGTLSAAGDFTRIKRTLGLRHMPARCLTETRKPSPFNHYDNTLLYISERVPFPDNKNRDYIAAVADEVERLVRASNGHAAVLFTSYNAMGLVYTMLRERGIPHPLFRMGKSDTNAIRKFKQSGNGVLFASGALWEGIDIPGDALSMLIIVKLPFPVPDPIGEYERFLCGSMDIYKNRVIIPDMQVRLRQGAGRGLRIETDSCVIALLDYRVREGMPYREYALRALPACPKTSDIAVAESYLRKKKSPEFWCIPALTTF